MKKVIFLCIVLYAWASFAQQYPSIYNRIVIDNITEKQIEIIQKMGIPLDCSAQENEGKLHLEVSLDQLARIRESNINYSVTIENLSEFYAQRARDTRAQAQNELQNMKNRALQSTNVRESLSTGEETIESFIQRESCDDVNWVSQNFRLGGFLDNTNTPFGGCYTVDELYMELDRMKSMYPDLISIKTNVSPSGMLTEGNPGGGFASFDPQTIYYVRISDNPDTDETDEPESLITGMTHSDEVNGLMNIVYYMWWLLENYETEPAIKNMIDHQELYFIPILNPDGLKINEIFNPDGGGFQRANANNVDLNRNFDYYWGIDDIGSSNIPTPNGNYRGPSPFSENETQILRDFVLSKDFNYSINHHSGITAIVTSSYNADPLANPSGREDEYQKLMEDITRYNNYVHGPVYSSLGYSANGDTNDWMLGGEEITYTAVNGNVFTTSGSGKNIIAFSPENGAPKWPPLNEIVPQAQTSLRMNLITSLCSGKYARLHDFTPSNVVSMTPNLNFEIEYLGQTQSDLTITITPISENITSGIQNITNGLQGMNVLEQRSVNASLTLNPLIQPQDPIQYRVTLSNDSYPIYEVIHTKYFTPDFIADADGSQDWILDAPWQETTLGFNGSTNAITTTSSPPYSNAIQSYALLNQVIDLSSYETAIISFVATWDIEQFGDEVRLEARVDQGSWFPLCGKYTKPDGVYNGDRSVAGVDKWIREEFLIDPDFNAGLIGNDQVEFRFSFTTNSQNISHNYNTEFKGFTFDDFQITGLTAPCLKAGMIENLPYYLDFEDGLEYWSQSNMDDGNWTPNIGATPSPQTGPLLGNDEASDGGTYYYLEASNPLSPQNIDPNAIGFNSTAILNSPCIDLSSFFAATLSFDYHMFGSNMGSLAVDISLDSGLNWNTIWQQLGEVQTFRADDWITVNIDLEPYLMENIRLRFVGTTGSDFRSDMAIDNIAIRELPCLDMTVYNNGSWDNGIPDETKTAIIASNYNTNLGNITACSLTILDDVRVIVRNGGFLKITNDIVVKGTLISQNRGSIVQVDNEAITDNSGSIRIFKRVPALRGREFILLSSPMTAETRQGAYGGADRVFELVPENFIPYPNYTGAINFIDDNGDHLTNSFPVLEPGIGYTVFPQNGSASQTSTFFHEYSQGTLNNGEIIKYVNYNGPLTENNFNILGNPYASAIDTDMFIANNNAINEVYFWEHNILPNANFPGPNPSNFSMDDVSIRNIGMGIPAPSGGSAPSRFMSSAQGFMILAQQDQEGLPITFNNEMRVVNNNSQPRSTTSISNKIILGLHSLDKKWSSYTGILFDERCSLSYDDGFDSERLDTSISLFSTLDNGTQLAIQGRESFNKEMSINLGFSSRLEISAAYKIELDELEGIDIGTTDIYLLDHMTKAKINLTKEDYEFIAGPGIEENRFTLFFQDELRNIETPLLSQYGVRLYPNPAKDVLHIQATDKIRKVIIYNSLGNKMFVDHMGQNNVTLNLEQLSTGMYFASIETASGIFTKKFILK